MVSYPVFISLSLVSLRLCVLVVQESAKNSLEFVYTTEKCGGKSVNANFLSRQWGEVYKREEKGYDVSRFWSFAFCMFCGFSIFR